ncbi:hypothetical protein [Polyangium jinanense]|uniref:Uncharacterized protein n=1 Tax=Polyangium jinanense TaxID=2829994 RepID=A0A9X3X493_9BACT|nr:hypothetical protein [Polyangium jinanense]MDC3954056.1 hypothetical protein [Polyangium jinanense]MDC3981988.1 hypothetical protein [Polyangium jinanense]
MDGRRRAHTWSLEPLGLAAEGSPSLLRPASPLVTVIFLRLRPPVMEPHTPM